MTIEVRVAGRGSMRDGEATEDTAAEARCDLCGEMADAVVSVSADASGAVACKACLRTRLEAVTLALFELRAPGERGLPWGKYSG
jgi:hypothetical protein